MRLLICLLFSLLLFTSCSKKSKTSTIATETKVTVQKDTVSKDTVKVFPKGNPENPWIPSQADLKPFLYAYGEENPETKVRIKTRFGTIDVELFEDTPLHRANFIFLVKNKYYNTTQFHRVSPDFVVQGGNNDTQTTARNRMGAGKYLLPNESSSKHKHVRGAFSAAKYSEQNVSKASHPFEFFIVQLHRGAHHLDGEHTVFGRVTKGMDVVDEMNKLEVDGTEWPLENVYMSIEVIE